MCTKMTIVFMENLKKIKYYMSRPGLPREAVNDFLAGYDNSSKKNLVENKIINEDTWQIG